MNNKIASRQDFAEYCLRRLGAPVINIEVAEEQIEDRIDEAISVFRDHHYDATEEQWVHYKVTEEDIENEYIEIPSDIHTVVSVIPATRLSGLSSGDMFSYQYQITVGELSSWQPFDNIDYFIKMMSIESTRQLLTVDERFKHNKHERKIRIYKHLKEGESLILRVYRIIDEDFVWNDRWLKQYAVALIKRQWAENISKFNGVALLGGVEINGDRLLSESESEIEKLEQQLYDQFSEPVGFIFG